MYQEHYLKLREQAADNIHETGLFGKGLEGTRSGMEEEDEPLVQYTGTSSGFEEMEAGFGLMSSKKNDTGLPDNLKTAVEFMSGCSLDNVKVHYNSDKPAQMQAWAYTQGENIYVGAGQEKYLPHETWHVVQQMKGRVRPTGQMYGAQINDDEALEHEASAMGNKALSYSGKILQRAAGSAVTSPNLSNGLCMQFAVFSSQQLGKIRGDVKYQYILERKDKFVNPLTNRNVICQIIERVFGDASRATEQAIAEVAGMLGIEVSETAAQGEAPIDRSQFSEIPDTCNDIQLRKILITKEEGRFTDKTTGGVYYHLTGGYPPQGKPIWQLESDGKIKIVGMYTHFGGSNKKYSKMEGTGPNHLEIK